MTSYAKVPPGASQVTRSPTLVPTRAEPSGELAVIVRTRGARSSAERARR